MSKFVKNKQTSLPTTLPEKVSESCCVRMRRKESLLIIFTITGVLVGILIGSLLQMVSLSKDSITLIMFPGEMLMRLLKMLIIPLISTSVITGIANLDSQRCGRVGLHTMIYYLSTTVFAVILGIVLVCAIQSGNERHELMHTDQERRVVSTLDTFLDLIRNIFPDNIIAACFQVVQTKITELPADVNQSLLNNSSQLMQDKTNSTQVEKTYSKTVERVESTNVLGLLQVSIFFGCILSKLGSDGQILKDFFVAFNKVFIKMIMVVMWYSPIGICSLIAGNIVKMGGVLKLLEILGLYTLTVIIGLSIHGVIILPLIYYFITRQNPFRLYAGVFQAWLTAFGTASSGGTLPVTMSCLEKNLKIDKRITRFVLPLGSAVNMDGTALLEGVAAITIAKMYGYSLTIGQIIVISITTTVASIGAACIPGGGLMSLVLVFSAIGLPSEAIGILWSIDWFLDRLRTSINVLGDCVGAAIVQHIHKDNLEEICLEITPEELSKLDEEQNACDNNSA